MNATVVSRLGLTMVAGFVVAGNVFAAESLEELLTLHRSAREAIQTFSCRVTVEMVRPTPMDGIQGQYWRSKDMVRVSSPGASGGSNEVLLKGSEIRALGRSPKDAAGKERWAAARLPKDGMLAICDAWRQMMIEFPGPEGGHMELDRLVTLARSTPKVSSKRSDGAKHLVLEMTMPQTGSNDAQVVMWFDSRRNYLVRKMDIDYVDSSIRATVEITEFAEFAGGIVIPMRCVRRQTIRDQEVEDVTTLTEVRVNEPIAPSVFDLPSFPSGTIVKDTILGLEYPINSRWEKIGKAEPFARVTVGSPANPDTTSSVGTASTSEARSWTSWLMPISLAILVSAGVLWIIRRRRNKVA